MKKYYTFSFIYIILIFVMGYLMFKNKQTFSSADIMIILFMCLESEGLKIKEEGKKKCKE